MMSPSQYNTIIFWMPAAAACVHVLDEFVFPGGFKKWFLEYKADFAVSVSDRWLFFINAALIGMGVNVGLLSHSPPLGAVAWLAMAALLFSNAVFHVIGAIETRKYSPGMITGLAIYVPLATFGFAHFLRSGEVSIVMAIVAAAVGGSYHFIAFANHRRRARMIEARKAAPRRSR